MDALIFDIDGTMADTEETHRTAFNLAFERLGLSWNWSTNEYHELLSIAGGKERIAAYIERLSISTTERTRLTELIPKIHAEKTQLYSVVVRDGGVPLRPGVARLLEEALSGGYRLAIASTTTAVNVDALLQATLGPRGLDMFSVIACGDQVRAKKPAPDIYRLALRHLGLNPDQAVAIEDSSNGLRAAVAAGLWTLVTPSFWTKNSDFTAAGLVLPHLGDPAHPLNGEPGGKLRNAAWLTVEELMQMAQPQRPANTVLAYYEATTG